jgi:type IV secretory pathway component VirB8
MGSRAYFENHDQQERSQAAPSLERLANTPIAVFHEGEERFAEIYGSSKVQAQRAFLIALGCVVLAISALLTVAMMLPLKEVRPWYVEISPSSGIVGRPVEALKVDPSQAVIRSELARWVEAMYTVDPLRSDELQRWAAGRTADKAVPQTQEFRGRERLYERIARELDTIRESRVTAVDATQKGTAFVFVTTTDRTGSQPPAPEQTRKFRVTLNYKLLPPTDEAKLIANPLGLYVTFFSDVEDRAK